MWWLVLDKPTADAAPIESLTTSQLLSSEDGSLFHVQPGYYSRNHCVYVVDPANLATIPNASLGSLNQGELWGLAFCARGTVCPQKNYYEKGTRFPYSKSIGAFNVEIG